MAHQRERTNQRGTARLCVGAAMRAGGILPSDMLPAVVLVVRVAPSAGLDPHDGLPASLKGPIDGIADALGLTNDRTTTVHWRHGQRRGPKGFYRIEVTIAKQRACTCTTPTAHAKAWTDLRCTDAKIGGPS